MNGEMQKSVTKTTSSDLQEARKVIPKQRDLSWLSHYALLVPNFHILIKGTQWVLTGQREMGAVERRGK